MKMKKKRIQNEPNQILLMPAQPEIIYTFSLVRKLLYFLLFRRFVRLFCARTHHRVCALCACVCDARSLLHNSTYIRRVTSVEAGIYVEINYYYKCSQSYAIHERVPNRRKYCM